MEKIKSDRSILKKFGLGLGTAFLLFTLILFKRHPQTIRVTCLLSFAFYVTTFINPCLLNPIYIITTRVSFVISWFVSRFILTIIFYFLFTPLGLIIKIFRIDLLDRKIDTRKVSYWKKKETNNLGHLRYEKQF